MITGPTDRDLSFGDEEFSPYLIFGIDDWADFRADTPMTLTAEEVERLRSLNDPIALDEVKRIYLSLSRLLSTHVEAAQNLYKLPVQWLWGNRPLHVFCGNCFRGGHRPPKWISSQPTVFCCQTKNCANATS